MPEQPPGMEKRVDVLEAKVAALEAALAAAEKHLKLVKTSLLGCNSRYVRGLKKNG